MGSIGKKPNTIIIPFVSEVTNAYETLDFFVLSEYLEHVLSG